MGFLIIIFILVVIYLIIEREKENSRSYCTL